MKNINVVIVDDHEIFRKGICALLYEFNFIKIIGLFADAYAFIEFIEKNKPDIVFMDIKMPGMNGIEATKLCVLKYPDIKVVALTMYDDAMYIEDMLEAGAKAFLSKNTNFHEIEQTLDEFLKGNSYFPDNIISIVENYNPNIKPKSGVKFSKREKEIILLLCKGLSTKEIADKLNISLRTVEGHKFRLMKKAEARNSNQLILFAIKNNLNV